MARKGGRWAAGGRSPERWGQDWSSTQQISSARAPSTTNGATHSSGSISAANASIAFVLAERRHEVWPAPDFPTSIGLRADGGAIVGLRDRVALWDYGGEFRTLAIIEPDLPDNRLNEGRVGPDGAFWVGTMQNNLHPDGAPKSYDPRQRCDLPHRR